MTIKCSNKFYCKYCGESDMSPNYTSENGDTYVKGWRCNICEKVAYPTIEKLNQEKKKISNNFNYETESSEDAKTGTGISIFSHNIDNACGSNSDRYAYIDYVNKERAILRGATNKNDSI